MIKNTIERTPNTLTIIDCSEDSLHVSLIAERDEKGTVNLYIDEVGESLSYSVDLDENGKQALIDFLQEK